jgi:heme exporter protein B
VEFRTKEIFLSVLAALLLVICLLSLGLAGAFFDPFSVAKIFPVAFWLSVITSCSISLGRAFENDLKSGVLHLLISTKIDLKAFFLAKLTLCAVLVFSAIIIGMLLQSLLLNVPVINSLPKLCLGSFLISISISALGILLSIVSAGSRIKSALLPIILIPCSFPVFFAALELTFLATKDPSLFFVSPWFNLSIFMAFAYSLLGCLLFPAAVKSDLSS